MADSETPTPQPQPPADENMLDAAVTEPAKEAAEALHKKRRELLKGVNTGGFEWQHLGSKAHDQFEEAKDDIVNRSSIQPTLADGIFYEILLCAKFYPERLSMAELLAVLQEMLDVKHKETLKSSFISMMNTFKLDDSIVELVRGFTALPAMELATHALDEEIITRLDLTPVSLKRKKVDYMVNNLVDQHKFNMLHESSEGYAKVFTLLTDASASEFSKYEIATVNRSLETCIGHFSLDPSLVLDIVISLGSEHAVENYRFWLDLLKESQWWPKGRSANANSLETLNDGGNEVAVTLIASKIRILGAQTMEELYVDRRLSCLFTFTCMLIKIGFVSFGSIYEALGPNDQSMTKLCDQINDSIEEEILKASANALALSGPLADEDENGETKPTTAPETKKIEEAERFNYKFLMLKSALLNGLYYPSVYLLTRYPTLAFADDEMPLLIRRVFKEMMKPLEAELQTLSDEQLTKLCTPKQQPGSHKEPASFIERDSPLYLDRETDVYFYYDWKADLPQIENVESLIKFSDEFLFFVGARLGEEVLLVSALSKLAVKDLQNNMESSDYDDKLKQWFEYFRKYILPASSYGHENPIAVYDTFQLLKIFPLDWRYNLYGELQKVTSKSNQYIKLNYSKAEKQTKDVLKRLTTENVKQTMRRLSKITFANPVPAFSVIISQVESYDNLIDLVVDAARYFTDYAWDVLPFVLLTRLTQSRQSIQSDGINDATWLQSLSIFIAKVARNYTAFDLYPILQFSLRTLHQNKSVGLTLLKQLITQMGGIQRFTNLVPAQIKFLNYGPSLQKVARKVIMDTRDQSKRSGERLVNELASCDMISEVFVVLNDFHKSVVEKCDDDMPFKILTERSDESAAVLHTYSQLVNFFQAGVPYLFEKELLSISELTTKYHVDIAWSYELWRSHLDFTNDTEVEFSTVDFENLSKQLYSDFWTLGLYDINFDAAVYTAELTKLEAQNKTITSEIRISLMDAKERNDRDNVRLRARLDANSAFNKEIIVSLPEDLEAHKIHAEKTSALLTARRSKWFTTETPSESELEAFIQFCVVPRLMHSETDAVFTGSFITSQLTSITAKVILNKIFQSGILGTLIFTATPIEAENIGLFVAEVIGFYETESTANDLKKCAFQWLQLLIPSLKNNLLYTENYMSRRNTLTFLKNLIAVVRTKTVGSVIHSIVEDVLKSETRDDLKLACSAVFALLQSASRSWVNVWDVIEFEDEERTRIETETAKLSKRRQLVKDEEKRAAAKKVEEERAARLAIIKAEQAERVARAKEDAERRRAAEEEERASKAGGDETMDRDETSDVDMSDDESISENELDLDENEDPSKSEHGVKSEPLRSDKTLMSDAPAKDDDEDDDDEAEEREEKENEAKDDEDELSPAEETQPERPNTAKSDDSMKVKEPAEQIPTQKTGNHKPVKDDAKGSTPVKTEDVPKSDVVAKDAVQIPSGPAAVGYTPTPVPRFKDVTGTQNALSPDELKRKMFALLRLLERGDLEGLVQYTNDRPSISRRLKENDDSQRHYRNNLRTILTEYIRSFSSNRIISTSLFRDSIQTFPIPRYQPPPPPDAEPVRSTGTAKRAPLPAQSEVSQNILNKGRDMGRRDDLGNRFGDRGRGGDYGGRGRDDRVRRDDRRDNRRDDPRDSDRNRGREVAGKAHASLPPPPPPPPPPPRGGPSSGNRGTKRPHQNDHYNNRRR